MGAVLKGVIKMWINRKTYNSIIKRIENLENNQFQANERVKQYIEDSESLSSKLCDLINALPQSLENLLNNNCCDK